MWFISLGRLLPQLLKLLGQMVVECLENNDPVPEQGEIRSIADFSETEILPSLAVSAAPTNTATGKKRQTALQIISLSI
jgi:hypothetical protein